MLLTRLELCQPTRAEQPTLGFTVWAICQQMIEGIKQVEKETAEANDNIDEVFDFRLIRRQGNSFIQPEFPSLIILVVLCFAEACLLLHFKKKVLRALKALNNRKRGEVILTILGCDSAVVSFCVEYECSLAILISGQLECESYLLAW